MKSKQPKFECCKTAREIETYLRMVLNRTGNRSKNSIFLNHYTKIDYLIQMMENGYMRLGGCSKMNDSFEADLLTYHGLNRKLFFSCFTKVPESLAMYKIYGKEKNSIIMRISFEDLGKFMADNLSSTDKYSATKSFRIMRDNKLTEKFIDGSLFITAIGYVDPQSKQIKTGTKSNFELYAPFHAPELAGRLKYNCWEYEDEIRLCAQVDSNLGEKDCLAVKIPDNFNSLIKVVLCPGFDKEKNSNFLTKLEILGINYEQSVYDTAYSKYLFGEQSIIKKDDTQKDLEKQILELATRENSSIKNIADKLGVSCVYVRNVIRKYEEKGENLAINDRVNVRYIRNVRK